ncbi:MAG: Disulfide bond formation protein D precursor [Chloroflexi bacterium ADurb.Bin325]|nr:MAG: Disulfide bond formation protein D precursor [Chloroflexi bacterium ADurb.Bin325]
MLLAIVIGVVVLAAALIIYAISSSNKPIVATERVGEGAVWGAADAPVLIEAYEDYGCHFCAQFSQTTGEQIRAEYEKTGKVRFEFKSFIIGGEPTRNAANAAECAADQGKFWDYHDVLFARQGTSANPFSAAALKQYAADLGLDTVQFNRCVDSGQHVREVNEDSRIARGRGVQATPTFFITSPGGTQRIEGAESFATFKGAIDAALASVQ